MANLPISSDTGLPLDPTTMQALQMQQMAQNIGMQGGTAATRLNETGFQQGLANLFPSPAVQEANQVQQALKGAALEQQPGESPLDFNIRQLQAQRDAVMKYSPESAAALNTQITKLAGMKFEQSHLLAQDQREEKLSDLQEKEIETRLPGEEADAQFKKETGNIAYLGTQDANGGMKFTAFDASNADTLQAITQQASKTGGVIMSSDQATRLMGSNNSSLLATQRALAQASVEYGNYDPDTVRHMAVDSIFNPGSVPYRGQGKLLVERWYSQNGILPSDIAGAKIEYKALMTAAGRAGSREGNMQTLENAIQPLGGQVVQTLGNVSRTDFAPLNNLIRAGKSSFSDPGEARYAAAVQSFVNEYARVINGGTGMTSDAAREEAWGVLNKAQGAGGIKAAVDQLANKETQIITNASDSAVEMLSNPNKYKSLQKIQAKAGYSVIPSNSDTAAVASPPPPTPPPTANRPPLASFQQQ